MGFSLFNTKPKNTYHGLLKTTDHLPITEMRRMTDGVGNDTPLWISPDEIMSTGNFRVYSEQSGIPVRHIIDSVDSLTPKILSFRTTDKQRWAIRVDGEETTGNAGSDFHIRRYNDAGTFIDAPFTINRKNGTIGAGTAPTMAKMTIRGDGTNPIFRAEHTDGTFRFINTHTYTSVNVGQGGSFYVMPDQTLSSGAGFQFFVQNFGGASYIRYAGDRYEIGHMGGNNGGAGMQFAMRTALVNTATGRFNFATAGGVTATTGTMYGINFTDTFAAAAGAANYRPLSINYTINNSGAQTGTMTGIFLNATETNLNGMTHNLMDLQVGGISRFRVDRVGNILGGDANVQRITQSLSATGGITLYHSSANFGAPHFYLNGTNLVSNYFDFQQSYNGTSLVRFTSTGINMFGTTVTTNPARIIVRGDGTNPIFRFETSSGVNALGLDAAGSTLVFNPAVVTANVELRATHYLNLKFITNYNNFAISMSAVTGASLGITNAASSVTYASFGSTYLTNHYAVSADMSFAPSTGSNTFDAYRYTATINQTGTANGITRGLYINPTLTSAVDFRGIEVKAGSTPGHKLLLLADGSGNKIFEVNGKQQIGFYGATPSDKLEVLGARSNPEEALASLLTTLATYGIILDSTTA